MQKVQRKTAETEITLTLDMKERRPSIIDIPLPFFAHLLNAMAWHGGFYLEVKGSGDIEVDPHHLVEDLGIVLGQAFSQLFAEGALARYGECRIPMDDALSEAVVDACRRPYLVYWAKYPQEVCGNFSLSLLKEFFSALAHNADINLHLSCRYGENSHHMAESLFKATGKALAQAFRPVQGQLADMSTKDFL